MSIQRADNGFPQMFLAPTQVRKGQRFLLGPEANPRIVVTTMVNSLAVRPQISHVNQRAFRLYVTLAVHPAPSRFLFSGETHRPNYGW